MKEKAIAPESLLLMGRSKLADYIALTKFRLLLLVLVTVGIGYYLASPQFNNLVSLFNVLLGVACVGAGANALNQWYEQDHDRRMDRTRQRPIPAGRLNSKEALSFGIIISFVGLVYLTLTTNGITVLLGLGTWASYLFIYTPLKPKTILNTWVGAIPGAIPPLMGWTALRGTLDPEALSLFAILYFWQLPHFFAISWVYRDDYQKGGFRMLSLVDPTGSRTSHQMLIHMICLLLASIILYFTQQTGLLYLVSAVGLGGLFLGSILLFYQQKNTENARRVFFASIIYFPILWIVMILDRILG